MRIQKNECRLNLVVSKSLRAHLVLISEATNISVDQTCKEVLQEHVNEVMDGYRTIMDDAPSNGNLKSEEVLDSVGE